MSVLPQRYEPLRIYGTAIGRHPKYRDLKINGERHGERGRSMGKQSGSRDYAGALTDEQKK